MAKYNTAESDMQIAAVERLELIFKTKFKKYLIELEFEEKIHGKVVKYKDKVSPLRSNPNGGHRHISVGKRMKEEGSKRGVEDLYLPIKNKDYTGLYIEVKLDNTRTTKRSYQKPNQKSWQAYHLNQGAMSVVCRSADSIVDTVLQYMEDVQ